MLITFPTPSPWSASAASMAERNTRCGPDVERARVDAVLGPRGDERVNVDRMDIGLGGGEKPCPHAHAGRAGRERGGHRAAGANAAGSENRNLRRGFKHLAKQMHEPDRAANMAAGLAPLRHNHIAAYSRRLAGLVGRPDLPRRQRAVVMDYLYKLRTGIAVEKLDNRAQNDFCNKICQQPTSSFR